MPSLALVDATDLETWADRLGAQSRLPEVIRRLILATCPDVVNIRFPAGEGVQQPGWDGLVVAKTGNAFVPGSTSAWELGTSRDVKRKADADYSKRSRDPDGIVPAETTFVFVTLRRWAGREAWVKARTSEGVWRDVRVYTADELEQWLQSAPAVHTWLSEILGKHPEDSLDLETYWKDWSQKTYPPVTAELLLQGRGEVADDIVNRAKATTGSLVVRAESREEALAVFAAAIDALPDEERSGLFGRAVLARSEAAWARLCAADGRLIVVPYYEEASEITRAIRGGHLAFVPLGKADAPFDAEIQLPRLPRGGVEAVLKQSGIPEDAARELARIARRSVLIFRRRLAVAPELRQPAWSTPAEARRLLPAMLAGAWEHESDADRGILSDIARAPYDEFADVLTRWSHEPDAPVQRSHQTWATISKEDMWALLSRYLLPDDIDRFARSALEVLGAIDPIFDLPLEERWMGRVRGHVLRYSDTLRTGIADSLAMLGAAPQESLSVGVPAADYAARIVSTLLTRANGDWRLWASLAGELALLAEAAPDAFIAGVNSGAAGDQPVLANLFSEQDSVFGSSPHTGLLWALETLAWSPAHLGGAARALARLAEIDPGGKLANRPAASLRGIFLPWHPQTAASLEQRLRVLDSIRKQTPSVAWGVMKKMLPDVAGGHAHNHPAPHWREWKPDPLPRVTYGDWLTGVREVVLRMVEDAGSEARRWHDLVSAIPAISEELEQKILEETSVPGRFDDSARAVIADALREVISRHRSFPDAEWALAKERVDRLSEAYERIRPVDPVTGNAWLFSSNPSLVEGGERDWELREARLDEARTSAVRELVGAHGLAGVLRLLVEVEEPGQLGLAIGKAGLLLDAERGVLHDYLASQDAKHRAFARGLVIGRVEKFGLEWLEGVLSYDGLSSAQRAEALACLRPRNEVWTLAHKYGPDASRMYWRSIPFWGIPKPDVEEAARSFLANARPYAAVELLAVNADSSSVASEDLVKALEGPLVTTAPADAPSSSFAYHAARLLDVLDERGDVAPTKLAQLEWAYITVLRNTREPKRLFDELGRSPQFFAELIALVYRAEGEEPSEVSEEAKFKAERAYRVLDEWRTIPGSTGPDVDVRSLRGWLDAARAALAANGRREIGELMIGQMLSGAPRGVDGAWPHPAVREVIEESRSDTMERGIETGVRNSRGVVTKSIGEGGAQERGLADQYEGYAATAMDTWPRTAAMLRRLAAAYRAEARAEDERAERDEGLFQVSTPRRRPKARPRPPLRAVQTWIWEVFTPQLDHLQYEKEVLTRTLSFRSTSSGFERLAPMKEALSADGQHVYDDLCGDLPEYDDLVREHDGGLDVLRSRAVALFSSLEGSARFRAAVRAIVDELRRASDADLPKADEENAWLRYLAADVVNDFPPNLTPDFSEWRVWNAGESALKGVAPPELRAALGRERERFAASLVSVAERLFALRKRLSRDYDIPVIRPVAES